MLNFGRFIHDSEDLILGYDGSLEAACARKRRALPSVNAVVTRSGKRRISAAEASAQSAQSLPLHAGDFFRIGSAASGQAPA